MSLTAQVVAELVTAGLSGEDLIAACKRIEDAEIPQIRADIPPDKVDAKERRRAWDRARKKRQREAAASANSTGHDAEKAEIPPRNAEMSAISTGIPPVGGRGESSLLPSLKDSGKEDSGLVIAREAKKRGTRLPADFVPDATVEARARKLGFTKREWDDWLEEFKDFWSARSANATMIDWQACARNSVKRFDRVNRRKGTNGTHQKPTMAESFRGALDLIDGKYGTGQGRGGSNILKLPGLG